MLPRATIVDRIVAYVQAHIESGQWPPGHRLPSYQQLRAIFDCSETPIKTAERILEASGWVEGIPGKGVFVAPHPPVRPAAPSG
ncbi:hypothetical protein GCM10009557_66490 [Virgisporangium ochraceum]|uniref:HTH gntR-type domain-containing protein n=1 Tax=Virgisporangium ochraceum TaxID=65505 RepID=A0A8J4EBV6_9ACTN|nr:hypothetical protein Voc01_011390 [Virgisporangium ochraceum]